MYKSELNRTNEIKVKMVTTDKLKLYYLPFGTITIIPLGDISSSFLFRRRQGRGGCLIAIDVNSQSPKTKSCVKEKVSHASNDCKRIPRNTRLARMAVRLLESDQQLKRVQPLAKRIRCGHIRSAIRSTFATALTPVQELSIKTSMKLEADGPCSVCSETRTFEGWKNERFCVLPKREAFDRERFLEALKMNIPLGWNKKLCPYIPTGSATLNNSRCAGGSWCVEEFSPLCKAQPIMSNGKPRVITMYSSFNTEILTPLNTALYRAISREGWLLVGSPTDELVKALNGDGSYVSVDYRNATDNIRADYCQDAIQCLIDRADGLSEIQINCLRVVGSLDFGDPRGIATRGQPMGSLISFPLLCIINKTTVDLALRKQVDMGLMSEKQFSGHRCLINGDDLLFREHQPSGTPILDALVREGTLVGLEVNDSKTMVDPCWAEINSTAFFKGQKVKKTNVASLQVKSEVTDAIGFICESVVRCKSFSMLLSRWKHAISTQERKICGPIPRPFVPLLNKIKPELKMKVRVTKRPPNLFPVEAVPDGYNLTRDEEISLINREVLRLRLNGQCAPKGHRAVIVPDGIAAYRSLFKRKEPCERGLSLLYRAWENKEKERLMVREYQDSGCWPDIPEPCIRCYEGLHSRIQCLVELSRSNGRVVRARSPQGDRVWGSYVSLGCNG